MREIKRVLNLCDQAIEILRAQRSRRSTTEVNRLETASALLLCDIVEFLEQRLKVLVHLSLPSSNRVGSERTIQTRCRAERDSDIETVSVAIIDAGEKLTLLLCNLNAQVDLLISGVVCLLHLPADLIFCLALFKFRQCDLCRSDSGQCAPRKLFARSLHQEQVETAFDLIFCLKAVVVIDLNRLFSLDRTALLAHLRLKFQLRKSKKLRFSKRNHMESEGPSVV